MPIDEVEWLVTAVDAEDRQIVAETKVPGEYIAKLGLRELNIVHVEVQRLEREEAA